MPEEFCVVCGATGRDLLDGVCAECAADRAVLVRAPERAVVVICPHCGARRVGARWERSGASPLLTAEDLTPLLKVHPEAGVRTVHWEETSAAGTVRELTGRARVRFRGTEREVSVPLSVRTEHHTCPECSRKSGRFYTALVQLRGGGERSKEKAPALRARLEHVWQRVLSESRADWRRAVSWQEGLPEGWDVFFTDTLAARAIARLAKQRFGARVTESASLFGRKDGRDIYRVTFCLRFPRPVGEPSGTSGRSPANLEQ
ncbi:MAG TPA: 60S ribosomal export protein NMD3 [Thermoplasmata archaeon]|nr:60S ribosomal export protein NMD3 [Thermoplasmata archaeon]